MRRGWDKALAVAIAVVLAGSGGGYASSFSEATHLMEAEGYAEAAASYQALTQQSSSLWDKAIASHSLARALLALGQEKKAIGILQDTLARYPRMPSLLRRELSAALAQALGQDAWLATGQYPVVRDQLYQAYQQLSLARHYALEAQAADCALQKDKGGGSCRNNQRLVALLAWIDHAFSVVAAAQRSEFLAPRELSEGVWRWQALGLLIPERLATLAALEGEADKKAGYLKAYRVEMESWLPLIQSVQDLAQSSSNSETAVAADKVKRYYEALLAGLNRGDMAAVQTAWEHAALALRQLVDALYGQLPGRQALYQLVTLYDRVLSSDPISSTALEVILQQENAAAIKQLPASLQKAVFQARAVTERAARFLQEGHHRLARLWLEKSKQILLRKLRKPSKKAVEALEVLIDEQRYILHLTHIVLQSTDNSLMPLERLLLKMEQKNVRNSLEHFLAAVKRQQEEEFKGQGEMTPRCQKRPWDKVLPLFYSGAAAVDAAEAALSSEDKLSLLMLLVIQKAALEAWQQALEALQAPIAPGDDSCYGQSAAPSDSKDSSDKPAPAPKEVADVLRQVQIMQEDDRLEMTPKASKKSAKPW